ncbi:hypothetical protein AOLI_G00113390 [Acnodon oligacanthus]
MENNQPNHAFSEMRKLPDGKIANDSEAQESSVNSLVALFQPHRLSQEDVVSREDSFSAEQHTQTQRPHQPRNLTTNMHYMLGWILPFLLPCMLTMGYNSTVGLQ